MLAPALEEKFSHGLLTESTVWRGEESIHNYSLSDLGLVKLSLSSPATWADLVISERSNVVYLIKKAIINILSGQWFLRKHLPVPCFLGTR